MVRVFLKGGVWKNSEDEILKAAVQKYGKQQWARVASLLNRKTAAQAKARWHEWLDPSIKKTEWSRTEEEKLLHLAKLLPAQWKTIAPIIGRTATQCQEHYEYLLDQAAAASNNAGASASSAAEEAASLSHLRSSGGAAAAWRPGQVDPHPETRPARPDPVDMDEDELEMLQEARARLANTVGKKAKRKQRERMLAQAKRLADLQKRRELKQAGLVVTTQRRRNRREIDLATEIPFYKPAPAGFHDVTDEAWKSEQIRQKKLRMVDYRQVNEDMDRDRDHQEARNLKREQSRLKILEQSNEKYAKAAAAMEDQEDAAQLLGRPRGALTLPAPMVSDQDMAAVAKWQRLQAQEAVSGTRSAVASGQAATQVLLSDYSDRPLPTPMRTPAVASAASRSTLLDRVSQLHRLQTGPTPLLLSGHGTNNTTDDQDMDHDDELAPVDSQQEDAKLAAVPTPRMPDRAGAGQTPHRDALGLNRSVAAASSAASVVATPAGNWQRPAPGAASVPLDDSASVGASTFASGKRGNSSWSARELAKQERLALKRARQALEEALAALPEPEFEYELTAPEAVTDDDDDKARGKREKDRADVEAAEREQLRKEAEKIYEAQSTVLKRKDLPRPPPPLPSREPIDDDELADIEPTYRGAWKLIQEEAVRLVEYDAYMHPLGEDEAAAAGMTSKKKGKKRKVAPPTASPTKVATLDHVGEDQLKLAKSLIEQEYEALMNEKIAIIRQANRNLNEDGAFQLLASINSKASEAGAQNLVWKEEQGWSVPQSEQDQIDHLRAEWEALQQATEALKKKNDKAETKLAVMNGGYVKKCDKIQSDMAQAFADLENVRIQRRVYLEMQIQERQGGKRRIEKLREQVAELRATEADLQKKYGDLVLEKRRRNLPRVGGRN